FSIQELYTEAPTDKKFYHYTMGQPTSDPVLNGTVWTREFETGTITVDTDPTIQNPSIEYPQFVAGVNYENKNIFKDDNWDFADGTTTGWSLSSGGVKEILSDGNPSSEEPYDGNYLRLTPPGTGVYVNAGQANFNLMPGKYYIFRLIVRASEYKKIRAILFNSTLGALSGKTTYEGYHKHFGRGEEEWYEIVKIIKINNFDLYSNESHYSDNRQFYVYAELDTDYDHPTPVDINSFEMYEYDRDIYGIKDEGITLSFDD
ncbi:unnamed protein product, partial [marine sediment metagenome]